MIKHLLLLSSFLIVGCSSVEDDFKLAWNDYYKPLESKDPYKFKKRNLAELKEVSFSVNNMSITDFVRHLSDLFDIGVIYNASLKSKTITAEFKNNSIDQILTTVSKSFDVKYKQYRGLYYLGELAKEDQSILVRRMHRLTKVEIDSIVKSIISTEGSFSVTDSGDIIISDYDDVLVRVSDTVDLLNQASSNSWVVQFYFLNYRRSELLSRGINMSGSGNLAFRLLEKASAPAQTLTGIAPSVTDGLSYDFSIDGLIDFTQKSDIIKLLNNPLILIDDGAEGIWKDSISVPIPQKTVSPEGTVTTNGFEFIETGSILSCKIRETSNGSVLTYSIEQSNITGFVENEAPIVAQSVLSSQVSLKSSGVYLLGELTTSNKTLTQSGWLHNVKDNSDSVIQVFARLYHID